MADRTYDNATTFEEMMAWHREDRPSCPSEVVVMARVGYGCEMCGWSVEEASLRLKDQSQPQPCGHWTPHPKDGFCVACGWAQVVHDIGSPSEHFYNSRWHGAGTEREISGLSQDELWAESTEKLDAFMAEHDRLVAENERHQRANLLRAVLDSYGTTDEFIKEAVNTNDFDRVPWLVAEGLRAENERLRGALERIAKEPAPGSTISCRNIAKAALSGRSETP